MAMADGLVGKRILLVEDDYIIAHDVARFLEQHGATTIGPAGTAAAALVLVGTEPLDGAVLDVNLHNEPVYPVADALISRDVPIVFVTGYDALLIEPTYVRLPRCEKPI